jgi:hypothetical protein
VAGRDACHEYCCFSDPKISKLHCSIELDSSGTRVLVRDMSANGIFMLAIAQKRAGCWPLPLNMLDLTAIARLCVLCMLQERMSMEGELWPQRLCAPVTKCLWFFRRHPCRCRTSSMRIVCETTGSSCHCCVCVHCALISVDLMHTVVSRAHRFCGLHIPRSTSTAVANQGTKAGQHASVCLPHNHNAHH